MIPSFELLLFLFCIGVLAAFLDVLAGGGGLLTLPALIMAGVPPLLALGTNKLQGTMGTATATFMMFRSRRVALAQVKWLMFTAFLGSALGSLAVQFIDARALQFVIPAVLLVIAIYFLLSPTPAMGRGKARINAPGYTTLVVPGIGLYDGMLGPGTGSFFAMAGVSLRGKDLVEATAIAKTLNFATNLAALLVFLAAGKVVWLAGMMMMAGQMVGAFLGARCLFSIQPRYLRGLIVLMCSVMLGKYLLDALSW